MLLQLDPEAAERFWAKVEKTDYCWNWTGKPCTKGYGTFRLGKMWKAHRLSYEMHVGPIPAGMLIDHKCRNKSCVNPEHLQPVTNKQNCENRSGAHVDSLTGVLGVSLHRRTGKYMAKVTHLGKSHYGGLHESIADAEAAATALRNQLFTNNLRDKEAA